LQLLKENFYGIGFPGNAKLSRDFHPCNLKGKTPCLDFLSFLKMKGLGKG